MNMDLFTSRNLIRWFVSSTLGAALPISAETQAPSNPAQDKELVELTTMASALSSPEEQPKLNAAWKQYKEQTEKYPVLHSTFTLEWLEPMARAGSDEMWNDYLSWFREKHRRLIPLDRLLATARPSLKPRLAPLLDAWIQTKISPTSMDFATVAQVARLLGDTDAIDKWVERTEGPANESHFQIGPMRNQLRLMQGDPGAMLPVVSAQPAAAGKWSVQWSLCGVMDRYQHIHCLDLGGSGLSGKFDLILYASPDPLHFSEISRISEAQSRGGVDLALPEGTRFLAIGATNRNTREWRRSEPFALDLAEQSRCEIHVPAKFQARTADRRVPEHPFGQGLPVHGVNLERNDELEIASLPWKHGYSTRISMWNCFEGQGTLEAKVLDPEGNVVSEHMIATDPPDMNLPIWSSANLELHSQSEINPARIVIIAKFGRQYLDDPTGQRRHTIWLTDIRRTDYEPNRPPAGTEIVGGAPAVITAFASDDTGDFLAMSLKGGRLALMDTKTGSVQQSQPGLEGDGRFVAANTGTVVAVDRRNNVHLMDRKSMALRKIGTLDPTLVADEHPVFMASPDGKWIVWLGRESDVYAARIAPDKLGEPVRIPVGMFPEMMIDRKTDTLHVSGPTGKFSIPFGTMEGLNPAELKPLADFGATRSVSEYAGTYRSYWVDPIHGIYTQQGGPAIQFQPDGRILSVPVLDSFLTVTPTGIVYISSSSGLIRRVDPATAKGYLPPQNQENPMTGHNPALMGDDEEGDI